MRSSTFGILRKIPKERKSHLQSGGILKFSAAGHRPHFQKLQYWTF